MQSSKKVLSHEEWSLNLTSFLWASNYLVVLAGRMLYLRSPPLAGITVIQMLYFHVYLLAICKENCFAELDRIFLSLFSIWRQHQKIKPGNVFENDYILGMRTATLGNVIIEDCLNFLSSSNINENLKFSQTGQKYQQLTILFDMLNIKSWCQFPSMAFRLDISGMKWLRF